MKKFIKVLLGIPESNMDYATEEVVTIPRKEKKKRKPKELSSKRIQFTEVDDENVVTDLADTIKNRPLVLNLEKLEPEVANHMLAFLSGVVYALDGEIIQLNPRIFLFANDMDMRDGSLKEFSNQFIEGE